MLKTLPSFNKETIQMIKLKLPHIQLARQLKLSNNQINLCSKGPTHNLLIGRLNVKLASHLSISKVICKELK